MKNPAHMFVGLLMAVGLINPLPAQEEPASSPEIAENYPASSPDELDDVLGPIALYPDDLISLILPAATQTTDIVLAARYLDAGGSIDDVDQQPWDESVRALAHFPEVVTRLNKDLRWTQQVGDEFLLQPAEVMKSIQRLRAKAYAAGTLRDTPQQKVLVDGNVIRIVPAVENVVYVPTYRTEVVYVDEPYYRREPCITFGFGWTLGSWYRWDCDWYGSRIWIFSSHRTWREHRWHNYHGGYARHDRGWDRHDGRAWNPPPRRFLPGHPGYHARHDRTGNWSGGYVDGHGNRDRDRRGHDGRTPEVRRGSPSSPTDVVVRDVIANQKHHGENHDRRGDNHDNRGRRPQAATPSHPATTAAIPPAHRATGTTTVTPARSPQTHDNDRSYLTRSRQETSHESTNNRTVRAYSPPRSSTSTSSRSPADRVVHQYRSGSSRTPATVVPRATPGPTREAPVNSSSNSTAAYSRGRSNQGGGSDSSSASSSRSSQSAPVRYHGPSRSDDGNNGSSSRSRGR